MRTDSRRGHAATVRPIPSRRAAGCRTARSPGTGRSSRGACSGRTFAGLRCGGRCRSAQSRRRPGWRPRRRTRGAERCEATLQQPWPPRGRGTTHRPREAQGGARGPAAPPWRKAPRGSSPAPCRAGPPGLTAGIADFQAGGAALGRLYRSPAAAAPLPRRVGDGSFGVVTPPEAGFRPDRRGRVRNQPSRKLAFDLLVAPAVFWQSGVCVLGRSTGVVRGLPAKEDGVVLHCEVQRLPVDRHEQEGAGPLAGDDVAELGLEQVRRPRKSAMPRRGPLYQSAIV